MTADRGCSTAINNPASFHGLYAYQPADKESFALMPVPLDHDARQQDILTAGTLHERDAIRAGWARGGTR